MAREKEEIGGDKSGRSSKTEQQEEERAERDYEIFLEDLEEDKELRQSVNIYKANPTSNVGAPSATDSDSDDSDAPEVNVDELLDELDDMTLDK